MSVTFKEGVHCVMVDPRVFHAIAAADQVYKAHDTLCVVTSLTDGQHQRGSLHYKGLAFDLRSKDIPHGRRTDLVVALQQRLADLDPHWQVIDETTHLHCELDLKDT